MRIPHKVKMKTNRFTKFLEKYYANKKCNPDQSIELPENHFYNKKVRDEGEHTLEIISKGKRRRRISKKMSRKESCLKVSRIKQKMIDAKIHENPRIRDGLHSMPSTLKKMPLIPFWRTSFDIIENQYEFVPVGSQLDNNLQLVEPDYITMRRKSSENEPIYI